SIIIDESDFERLGINKVGDTAEINKQRVRVVNATTGVKSLAGPYVFANVETARSLLRMSEDQTMFILARCRNKADAAKVVQRLGEYRSTQPTSLNYSNGQSMAEYPLPPKMAAFTSEAFSLQS